MENEKENQITQAITTNDATDKKLWGIRTKYLKIGGIVLLLLLIVIGIFATVNLLFKKGNSTQNKIARIQATGYIAFGQKNVFVKQGQKTSVDIVINTGGKQIAGVILTIQYNPHLLTNVSIESIKSSNSALSYALMPIGHPQYDAVNGNVTLTFVLPKDIPALSGSGRIATLIFTPKTINLAITNTPLSFARNTNFITPKGQEMLRANLINATLDYTPPNSALPVVIK